MAGRVAMYCRPQEYLSPLLIVPIEYHARCPRGKTLGQFFKWHREAHRRVGRCYITFVPEAFGMVFLISQVNGCTYTLDPDNRRVLMYAPLLEDGSYETTYSAYDWVEWDRLNEEAIVEAERCHKLLLADTGSTVTHPLDNRLNPCYITFVPETTTMPVTIEANYREVFSAETVAKIDELLEENFYLNAMLEFINEHSEDDFVSFYEEYVSQGEDIGYVVVDAFVDYHGIAYVEHARDAYRGSYNSQAEFAEEYLSDIHSDLPAFVVIDWQATWDQNLRYDFDFVNGFVFDSDF